MKRLIPFLLALACLPAGADGTIGFNQDIRPILSNKCMQCHGPDAGLDARGKSKRKGGLRLDQADGPEGAYRVRDGVPAITPGDLARSEVWKRVTSDDPDEIMPPSNSHETPLDAREREIIRTWILEGAQYQQFWAFVPARVHPVPDDTSWSSQEIDRFVLARLKAQDLAPSPEADPRTLIRRVTFDLTGLPPSPAEIATFLDDASGNAYENLVERLLAKPQYGEHMAKYWLDLVRFADTNGMHHDHYRDLSPYRDWVIRAFNANLRFDDFIKFQVAGDLYPEATVDQQVASGFNRLHLIIDRGTALPEESFTKNVIDRVSAVGTAFMGLTLQCAVCHDHKYDPITQKDFYQIYALFNNFDGDPETGGRGGTDFQRGLQPPYINLPSPEQETTLQGLDDSLAATGAAIQEAQKDAANNADRIMTLQDELKKQQAARDTLLTTVPAAMVMKEHPEPRPAHILIRGAYDQPGEVVTRDTPSFLPPLPATDGTPDRMDFARWLVARDNPLTARVAANRFWQQFFGVGLVKTAEDFGAQGEWPSHPELLDHLTLRLVGTDWNVKEFVRSIVLSKTYRQTSAAPRERFLADPENRLLARGSRFRLDSEVIRDQILAVSGLLSPEMYGKSVKPPQPAGLWKIVTMPSSYPREFVADTGDQIHRRSVYTFWKRGLPPPQMTILDAPSRESCIARRERTNTPLQALLLMNEEQYFAAATHYAHTLLQMPEANEEARIRTACEAVTSRLPGDETMTRLTEARQQFLAHYTADPAAAKAMLDASPDAAIRAITDPARQAELASWTMLVHSLLNLDATKTRE